MPLAHSRATEFSGCLVELAIVSTTVLTFRVFTALNGRIILEQSPFEADVEVTRRAILSFFSSSSEARCLAVSQLARSVAGDAKTLKDLN